MTEPFFLIDVDKGERVQLSHWRSSFIAVVVDCSGHHYIKTARGLTNLDGSEVESPIDELPLTSNMLKRVS